MSNYFKTKPEITYKDFLELVISMNTFNSITGNKYNILSIERGKMKFVRMSTNKEWVVDLEIVHKAYQELVVFRTTDFALYMPRTKSPALGLLLTSGLLQKL